MDSKGTYEKITYPEIYFSIDNYEEVGDVKDLDFKKI